MTHRTEQYLRNYLEKKALVVAAEQEVKEATRALNVAHHSSAINTNDLAYKRRCCAVALLSKVQTEEFDALQAYMEHLRSEQ